MEEVGKISLPFPAAADATHVEEKKAIFVVSGCRSVCNKNICKISRVSLSVSHKHCLIHITNDLHIPWPR